VIDSGTKLSGSNEYFVKNVYNFGAGDLLEIADKVSSFLIPFKCEYFPNNDIIEGCDCQESMIFMTKDALNLYGSMREKLS
jgi:ribosomal 30S subunit maturation factor RimM